MANGRIRIGIGGWKYDDWRGPFYPAGLPQKRELAFAAERLTAIEVNGTFYGTLSAKTFAGWRDETPDDFVFALKAPRYATNRRVLAEAGESIARFAASGIAELGPKLGPINWQFAATKAFDAQDFEAFLKLLPAEAQGVKLRHALEVRHASFDCAAFRALAATYGVAVILAGDSAYPGSTALLPISPMPASWAPAPIMCWAIRGLSWTAGRRKPAPLPQRAATCSCS